MEYRMIQYYSGFSGYSGWSGWSGQIGQSGFSGWSGMPGAYSASGFSGWSGWSGQMGASGPSGPSGPEGTSGQSGWSGMPGAYSASGFSGWSGQPGASGTNGYLEMYGIQADRGSGHYIQPTVAYVTTLSTFACAGSQIYGYPLVVAKPFTAKGVRFTVTAGTTSIQIGIYTDNNSTPGTLVCQTASTSISSTGVKTVDFESTATLLPNKIYWIVYVTNGSLTLRAFRGYCLPSVLELNPTNLAAGTRNVGYQGYYSYAYPMPTTYPIDELATILTESPYYPLIEVLIG